MRKRMIVRRCLILGLVIAVAVIGVHAEPKITSSPPSIALSETNPYPVVLGAPVVFPIPFTNITLFVPGGDQITMKTLNLDATGNITNLSTSPPDISQAEGRYPLSPDSVNVSITGGILATLRANGAVSIPVIFQFGNIHSGKYTGDLRFSYTDDTRSKGSLSVPITLTVKDHPLVPILILLIGVFVGILYFSYRETGRAIDEFRLYLERFKEVMDRDKEYQALPEGIYFRKKISAEIEGIALDLLKPDLASAQKHLDTAKGVWGEWLLAKRDLTSLLEYEKKLRMVIKKLRDQFGVFLYLDGLEGDLDKAYTDFLVPADFTAYKTAFDTYRVKLNETANKFNSFQTLVRRVAATEQNCRANNNQDCLNKVQLCWNKLRGAGSLPVSECDALAGYFASLGPDTGDLKMAAPSPESKEWPGPALSWFLTRIGKGSIGPTVRLGLFSVATLLILTVILSVTGYQQLYESNSTFGAGVSDYIGVLLWGFGVGPGSEAFVKALTQFSSVKMP